MESERHYIVGNEEIIPIIDRLKNTTDVKSRKKLENKLVSRLTFLVQSRIKSHKGSPIYDDLLQEGRLGIVKAIEDFRPERGRNFFMFANWHIRTRVRRLIMRQIRIHEVPSGDSSFFECTQETQDTVETDEDRKTIKEALSYLSDNDRRVLEMRFGFDGQEPCTFQQIGNTLGISRQRVQQIEANALRRLKENRSLKQQFCE